MDTIVKLSNTVMETCANLGCSEPGTNKCASCKTTPYCGPICQTEHWPTHKECCDGRLRKMGMDHLKKARGFYRENNWLQSLRHSDLALTKLKQLKDRPIEDISDALSCKCIALEYVGRYREQLECAKEWYCLWNTKPTDMGAIDAAFALIQSCIRNNKFEDARLYASTLYGIINHKYDNKIPEDQRQRYIAKGAYYLADATLALAKSGGIPPAEKQKEGQEAIALARKALEIHTQLNETEDGADDMTVLAEALDYFNEADDDDEVLRLFEQAKAINARVYGRSSLSVALGMGKLGETYFRRAKRAHDANDLDREQTHLEMALSHIVEALPIFQAIGRADMVDLCTQNIFNIEEKLRQVAMSRAVAEAVAAKGK